MKQLLGLVLVLAVAARVHVTVMLYGCPVSVPLVWFAAAVAGLPFVLVLVAGRRVMACNRWPRIAWWGVPAA